MARPAIEIRCHLHLHGLLKGDVAEFLGHQGISDATLQLKRSLGVN